MSKIFVRRLIYSMLGTIGILIGYKTLQIIRAKEDLEFKQTQISLEGKDFLGASFSNNGPNIVLSLFHPSCDFCQADAEQFRKSYVALKNLEVLWVSYDEKDSIQKFSQSHGLDTLPNMHFAFMDIEAMLERYGNVKFPTFLAYDDQGKLLKKFVGLTKPEEILKAYQIE